MNHTKLNYGSLLFLLGAASCLALLLLRAMNVISFGEAHHVVTSGFEEESLYAMWKYWHGLPVYNDPHQIPFSASYFNWFFYGFYGSIIKWVMTLFALPDVWLPTVGRIVTLSVVFIGFAANYYLYTSHKVNDKPLPFLIAICLSALLWFSPLIGFWAMTVRPDVIALLFDVLAVTFFLKYPSNTVKGVILASLFCYLSWSCKQVNVVMPGAIGLFLLLQQRWRSFIVFSMLMVFGYTLTLALAEDNLLKSMFFVKTAIPLSFDVFWANLLNFIKKSFPALILFGMIFTKVTLNPPMRKAVFQEPMVRLAFCGLVFWVIILLPFSSKIGSADNYHFIALFFVLLATAGALKHLLETEVSFIKPSFAFSGLVSGALVVLCLSQGTLGSIQAQHQNNLALKSCLDKLPQPIFVVNHYASLPWMNPSPVSFVLAYNYWQDRSANRPFEHNGIGGLISQGYFNTLIIPKEFTRNFDGAALNHYHQEAQGCMGYAVLKKKDKA